jgi:hypothetical protein
VNNVTVTCLESYPAKVGGTMDVKETVMLHRLLEMASLLDDQLQSPESIVTCERFPWLNNVSTATTMG